MKRNILKFLLALVVIVPCAWMFTACKENEGGSNKTYSIEVVSEIENGTVVVDKTSAKKGEKVTLTLTPASEMFGVSSVLVNSGDVEVSGDGNTRTFNMPAKNVSISVVFGRKYRVSKVVTNGEISLNEQDELFGIYALPGETVTIDITPEVVLESVENYLVDDIVVGLPQDEIEVEKISSTKYSFVMVEKNVQVSVRMFNILDETDLAEEGGYTIEEDGTVTINKITGSCYGIMIPDKIKIGEQEYVISGFEAKGTVQENKAVFKDDLRIVDFHNVTSLKKIGTRTFNACTRLQEIVLPESVMILGEDAFKSCTSLETIELGSLVEEIDETSFAGTSKLGTIVISTDNTNFVIGFLDGYFGLFAMDQLTGEPVGDCLKELL